MIAWVKTSLLGTALALMATPAMAATVVLTPSQTGDYAYTYSVTDKSTAAGTFTDTFQFTIPGTIDGLIDVALINTGTGANNIDFSLASVSGDGVVTPLEAINAGNVSQVYDDESFAGVAGVTYLLSVKYTAAAKGATFNGNVSFTATPPTAAPEPAAWALMIAGFAAVGGALRSRRKNAVSFA